MGEVGCGVCCFSFSSLLLVLWNCCMKLWLVLVI